MSNVNCKFINYSMLHHSVLIGQGAIIACFVVRFAQVHIKLTLRVKRGINVS
jgi:hypothetical protein